MSSINAERVNAPEKEARVAPAMEWWRGAVIYQIYPRSFLDSNGDGIGDLKGVLQGLDYVADLGVDGVWLSPFFTSPMNDFGYDVADFRNVDPIFGDLADFDAIVEKAHRLGLKVIIDQVYSHTSDEHEWFKESRADRTNPKTDWYVWADPKPDGSPPNNWQSVFGGGAWEWDSRRRQYYFHNFLKSQPDLNLHNNDVRNALLDVARFWLERGVDGFRLDALNFAMHDTQLRDNPPAPEDGRLRTRPFDYQLHIYSQSHPEIPLFLEEIRRLTNEYDGVFTVAEVGGPNPLAEMKAFTAGDTHLNSAYNFSFLYADKISPALTREAVSAWTSNGEEGWPSWAFSNHDAPRAISRWAKKENHDRAAKLYAMLLLSLRGNAFIYQGEELGLPQADLPFEAIQDPEAIANWPLTLGRDGARTPIPWKSDNSNGGFSTGKTWLPVDPAHLNLSVEKQQDNPRSVLNFIRTMIALRKKSPAMRNGDLTFIDAPAGVLAFYRSYSAEKVLCVFNLGEEQQSWLPADANRFQCVAETGLDDATTPPENLPPLSGYIAIERS